MKFFTQTIRSVEPEFEILRKCRVLGFKLHEVDRNQRPFKKAKFRLILKGGENIIFRNYALLEIFLYGFDIGLKNSNESLIPILEKKNEQKKNFEDFINRPINTSAQKLS